MANLPTDIAYLFSQYFNQVSSYCHQTSKEHGFYENGFNDGEKIALMHSELSECLEAVRHGDPQSEKTPEFSNGTEELADAVIRIMDYAQAKGYNLGAAIIAKAKFNESRPFKHGKNF